jgi:hypothetical protein
MLRKMLLLFTGCYFSALAVLAISLHNASPGPGSQEILGVGIGRYDGAEGIVYLSGRYLHCSQAEDPSWAAICAIEIAGQPLEIRAQRNPPTDPNQLGGRCAAFYAGQPWPCRIGLRHVQVAWFAYLDEPLGLDKAQLDALRRAYFLENLPESSFVRGITLVTITTAILALLSASIWLWPRMHNKFFYTLAATACGMLSGLVTFFLAIFLTNGFWD